MRPAVVLIVASMLAFAGTPAVAAPVVAGFERFGRSAEAPAARVEAGLVLLGELGCTNCHAADERTAAHLLPKAAPILDGVGKRLDPAWITAYLADPHGIHPGTTMPDLLAALPADRRTRTVLALTH